MPVWTIIDSCIWGLVKIRGHMRSRCQTLWQAVGRDDARKQWLTGWLSGAHVTLSLIPDPYLSVSRMFQCLQEAVEAAAPVLQRPHMQNGGIPAPPPTYVAPVGSSFNT